MTDFHAADGTRLTYHQSGDGDPVICLPGGPMLSSEYLQDLGGLSAYHRLVCLDPRGTGASAVPDDQGSYRCDRLVDDVEVLRTHLGTDQIDLLGHSAGGSLAVLYAARHPDRVRRLVLVTPSPRPVGLEITDLDRRRVAELRRDEPWFPDAFAAFERIWAGEDADTDWDAITPFMHGRWDAATQADVARQREQRNTDAAKVYYADGAVDPDATRLAIARLDAPVLIVAGEHDVALPPPRAAEYADLFGRAEVAVLAGGGHQPWCDDPDWFVSTLTRFLR